MAPHDASTQQGNAVAASKSLKVATVTWNMANREPSDDDIQLIMEKLREMDADVVIVATQEERRLERQTLACKLNESLAFEVTNSRHAYNTITTGFGRVAACVLARPGFTVKCLGVDKFAHAAIPGKYPNKGGVTLRFECKNGGQPAVKINAACVHLDSYDEQARLQEMQILMAKLSGTAGGFVDWQTFEKHAADLTIAAGDFNYRIEREGAGKFTDTPRALTYVQTSRCLVDAASKFETNVTYRGKNQSVASPLGEMHDTRTEDTHRTVVGDGQDATVSCKGGRLDRVHFENGKKVKQVIVEGTCTSDHKPVVAMATALPAENSFKRAKKALAALVTAVTPGAVGVINAIATVDNNELGRRYLQATLNYYLQMQQLRDLQESLRLQRKPDKSQALKQLTDQHVQAGAGFFSDVDCLDKRPNCELFIESFRQRTQDAVAIDKPLASHSGFLLSIVSFIVRRLSRAHAPLTRSQHKLTASVNRVAFTCGFHAFTTTLQGVSTDSQHAMPLGCVS